MSIPVTCKICDTEYSWSVNKQECPICGFCFGGMDMDNFGILGLLGKDYLAEHPEKECQLTDKQVIKRVKKYLAEQKQGGIKTVTPNDLISAIPEIPDYRLIRAGWQLKQQDKSYIPKSE